MKLIVLVTLTLLPIMLMASDNHDHHDHEVEFTEHQAHEHGKAIATLSYSNSQLNFHIALPAVNTFGFEHAPRDNDQQAIVDNVTDKLSKPDNIILFQPICASTSYKLSNHQDNLSESNSGEEHFDVELEYIFHCSSSDTISIDFSLFETIPSLEEIEVQYISDHDQQLITLDASNRTMKIH